MFKFKHIASSVIAGMLLVGCGGGISDEALEATGLKGAPKWVIEGGEGLYSAVGDAPIINNNVNFARTEALAAARAEVAKQISVKVSSYLKKTTQRQDVTLNEDIKNEITETAQKDLTNSSASAFWISDDGKRAYILMKLSEEAVDAIKKALEKQEINVMDLEQDAMKYKAQQQQ